MGAASPSRAKAALTRPTSSRQCWREQPPQTPKCLQMGEMRSGEGLSMAVASPFAPAIRALIVSPGKVKGICTLFSPMKATPSPCAAIAPIVIPAICCAAAGEVESAVACGGDERLFITVMSLYRRGKRSQNCPPRRLYMISNSLNGGQPCRRILDDAALADQRPPDLELWLHQNNKPRPFRRQWKRWRQDLEQRNETHITCHCFDRRLKLCSRQRSGVPAFPGDDPGIRPQRGMELIAANIHSKYAGRSALQQNLCKTSG